MWHLPIPYRLLLKSQPQKENNFITYSGYLPYLYEKYPKFMEETKNVFSWERWVSGWVGGYICVLSDTTKI